MSDQNSMALLIVFVMVSFPDHAKGWLVVLSAHVLKIV